MPFGNLNSLWLTDNDLRVKRWNLSRIESVLWCSLWLTDNDHNLSTHRLCQTPCWGLMSFASERRQIHFIIMFGKFYDQCTKRTKMFSKSWLKWLRDSWKFISTDELMMPCDDTLCQGVFVAWELVLKKSWHIFVVYERSNERFWMFGIQCYKARSQFTHKS